VAYVEAHQTFRDHRKVWELSAELGIPEAHVAGYCVLLWLWSLDHAQDGVLPESHRSIERACGWPGEPGALVEGMEAVGLLDRREDGRLVIHDWDVYTGRLMDQRRSHARSQQAYRDRQRESEPAAGAKARGGHVMSGDGHVMAGDGRVVSRDAPPYPTVPRATC
jgi:hypothetical protein